MQAALAACILLLVGIGQAEPPDKLWTGHYPASAENEELRRALITSDSGYILGIRTMGLNSHYQLVKVDSVGKQEWTQIYGSQAEFENERIGGIATTPDGGYMVSGTLHSRDAIARAGILKVDAQGDSIWSGEYGSYSWFYDATAMSDGCIIAAGETDEYAEAGASDAYLVKVNLDGEVVWRGVYGGRSLDWFNRVIPTTDGGLLAVGGTNSFGGRKAFAVKVDSSGEQQWIKVCSTNQEDHNFASVVETPDHGFLACGGGNQGNQSQFYIVRFCADGDTVWSRKITDGGVNFLYDITNSPGGGYLAVGSSSQNGYMSVAVRLNDRGQVLWNWYIGMNLSGLYAVMTQPDGGYAIGGTNYYPLNDPPYATEGWMLRTTLDQTLNSVSLRDPAFPSLISLEPPYPNPFNTLVNFTYRLPTASLVELGVYNLAGCLVTRIVNERQNSGEYRAFWETDGIPTGIYLARLQSSGFTQTQRVVLIK